MTCTHAGIFSPTHHFPEVKFPCLCGGGAMRQRKLGSHTPPCHRRMVITTLFRVGLGGGGYCPFIPIFLK